jgi:hypothetical protein
VRKISGNLVHMLVAIVRANMVEIQISSLKFNSQPNDLIIQLIGEIIQSSRSSFISQPET